MPANYEGRQEKIEAQPCCQKRRLAPVAAWRKALLLTFALALLLALFTVSIAFLLLPVSDLLLAVALGLHAVTVALLRLLLHLLLLIALLLAAILLLVSAVLGLLTLPVAALLLLLALLIALPLLAFTVLLLMLTHVLVTVAFLLALALPLATLALTNRPFVAILTLIDGISRVGWLAAVDGGGTVAASVTAAVAGIIFTRNRDAGRAQRSQRTDGGPACGG